MKVITGILGTVASAGSALGAGGIDAYGVIALNGQVSGALTMVGNARIEAPAVYVNSCSPTAVKATGSAIVETPSFCVVPGVIVPAAHVSGPVNTMPQPRSDPLFPLTLPGTAGLPNHGKAKVNGGQVTLSPGYYPLGITVTGNATVNLSPGVYVIGTELRVSSGKIVGDDVSLVILSGGVTFSGSSTAQLTPRSDGDLAGVVIAQAPANPTAMTLTGGSGMAISGTIYAPSAPVTLTGHSMIGGEAAHMGDLLVVNRLTLTGLGTIRIGPSGALPGHARHD